MLNVFYTRQARKDLAWFVQYYDERFPEGRAKASITYMRLIRLLKERHEIGAPIEPTPRRSFLVVDTPFRVTYQVRRNRLEIVRLIDTRKNKT